MPPPKKNKQKNTHTHTHTRLWNGCVGGWTECKKKFIHRKRCCLPKNQGCMPSTARDNYQNLRGSKALGRRRRPVTPKSKILLRNILLVSPPHRLQKISIRRFLEPSLMNTALTRKRAPWQRQPRRPQPWTPRQSSTSSSFSLSSPPAFLHPSTSSWRLKLRGRKTSTISRLLDRSKYFKIHFSK